MGSVIQNKKAPENNWHFPMTGMNPMLTICASHKLLIQGYNKQAFT